MTEPTKKPPIPDYNGNGALDAEDILEAMKQEEQAGSHRTPNERAHGVMETAGTRQVSREVLTAALVNGGMFHPQHLLAAQKYLSSELAKVVRDVNEKMSKNPNFRQFLTEQARAYAKQENLDPDMAAVVVADQLNAADFAESFAKTFPKGIQLEDMSNAAAINILRHFSLPDVTVPQTPRKPSGQTI